MNVEQLIEAGIRSAESGDTLQAQKLFAQAVKMDPESELAWQSLGHVLTDPVKIHDCFQRVLQINPHNLDAKRALEKIASPPSTNVALDAEFEGTGVRGDSLAPHYFRNGPKDSSQKKRNSTISLGIGTIVILSLIVLLSLIVIGWISGLGDQLKGLLFSSSSGVSASPAATLPPTWTYDPIPPSETLKSHITTPEPTQTPSYENRLIAAQSLIDAAFESNKGWDCQKAIEAWTNVIEALPEYGTAYYWRAYQYQCQSQARGDINEYRRSLIETLEDINQAIAIDPESTGDYFALRYAIYADLASTYETRVDYELLNEFATDDLEIALFLGSSDPLLSRTYGFQLAHTGHCEEAISQAKRLRDSILPGEQPSAGIQTVLAPAYICKGQYMEALNAINAAINLNDSELRRYTRAMIYYGLGQLENALADLDEIIEQNPTFEGYRYYLRALVHYDLGHTVEAIDDLRSGFINTWGHGCAASLVEGLIALEEEDIATATDLFEYSESTCTSQSRPVWTRVLQELEKLNLEPVVISSSVELPPAPTTIFQPIDQTKDILPYPPASERTYESGTGSMLFSNQGGYITMHFTPDIPMIVNQVLSLTIDLETDLHPGKSHINIYLLNPTENIWSMYPWEGQPIYVTHPERFIYPDGGLYMSTYVFADKNAKIKNATVNLELITNDDKEINLIYEEPKPSTYPTPAILAYATPIPYSISAPFKLDGKSSVLFKLSPEYSIPIIDFVNSLTFHFSANGEGQSTLDFSYWNPTSGGWSMNQGDNKIGFGESDFQISTPDLYVTRAGEIYLSLRNYGSMPIEIIEISAIIEARTEDGQIIEFGDVP